MKQVLTIFKSLVLRSPFHLISQHRSCSNYLPVLFLAGIMMLLSSCHKEDKHCRITVPFKAKFTVTSEVIKTGPPIQQQHLTAVGEGTPIGKATFEDYVDFDVSIPSPTPVNGKQTITTENGDKIFVIGKGYAVGPDANGDIKIVANDIITGGTGKYSGATGSFVVLATASVKSPTGSDTDEGSITY
ncbi:MAG TPA: hypothetical protein VKA92_11555 [Segetibacter sp.]|nr:hypothetical protein [Segetibacter sp.]